MKFRFRSIMKMLFATLFLLIVVAMSFFSSLGIDETLCDGVNICIHDSSEMTFISQKDIEGLVQKSPYNPLGKPMHAINTESLELYLHENPMIKRVECYTTIGRKVAIEVYQRIPILRVMSANGNYYVDNEGAIMPVSIRYSVNTPLASGFVTKEFAQNELFHFAIYLQKNRFWNALIGQIYVHPNKEVVLIPRVGEQEILLGSLERYEEKLDNLIALYGEGFKELGWNRYENINLKYYNQVICTKK